MIGLETSTPTTRACWVDFADALKPLKFSHFSVHFFSAPKAIFFPYAGAAGARSCRGSPTPTRGVVQHSLKPASRSESTLIQADFCRFEDCVQVAPNTARFFRSCVHKIRSKRPNATASGALLESASASCTQTAEPEALPLLAYRPIYSAKCETLRTLVTFCECT